MGLKPDHWIRQMAIEHQMIEPFVDHQVRDGLISFGLSSYGYDIRVAQEFKIFTPGLGDLTVVDPKKFDTRAMVDFRGDVCIIPPNSFALARSVEYFCVPRSVLCVCLGKSTYARCFSGDTRIALVDGTSPTLEDMAERSLQGERFWGYSVDPHGRIIVTLLDNPRHIGSDALLEITLDNDKTIHCTPDHQFITRDGQMIEAHTLRPGVSLMPLYRQIARGYEAVYQPIDGHPYPTHRLADEWNIRHNVYEDIPQTHRHHKDHNKMNNNPWNITRIDASDHIRYHDQHTYGDDFDPDRHGAAIRDALERLSQDVEWRERFIEAQRQRAIRFWNDEEYAGARASLVLKQRARWSSEDERQRQRERQARFWREHPERREIRSQLSKDAWARAGQDRRERQREIMRRVRIRDEITADVARAALNEAGSIRGAARLLQCDRSVFRRLPDVIQEFKETRRNHKVVSVEELPGDHDVYCLTVPEAGTFALDAGVFTHNCGIIVNTTPFEPEWQGYVTLEISNTAPLPAKIYANEGIAQVLFFEADEECTVSYADRKGKYQSQESVTLPRL